MPGYTYSQTGLTGETNFSKIQRQVESNWSLNLCLYDLRRCLKVAVHTVSHLRNSWRVCRYSNNAKCMDTPGLRLYDLECTRYRIYWYHSATVWFSSLVERSRWWCRHRFRLIDVTASMTYAGDWLVYAPCVVPVAVIVHDVFISSCVSLSILASLRTCAERNRIVFIQRTNLVFRAICFRT